MGERYKIGDFGCATFIAKRGWKAPTTCYGHIIDIDSSYVLFRDNDDNEYIIKKTKFNFEKAEFKVKV